MLIFRQLLYNCPNFTKCRLYFWARVLLLCWSCKAGVSNMYIAHPEACQVCLDAPTKSARLSWDAKLLSRYWATAMLEGTRRLYLKQILQRSCNVAMHKLRLGTSTVDVDDYFLSQDVRVGTLWICEHSFRLPLGDETSPRGENIALRDVLTTRFLHARVLLWYFVLTINRKMVVRS